MGHTDKCSRKNGVANRVYEGALTLDANTMFHSCESRGTCHFRDSSNVVQIIPVTSTILLQDAGKCDNEGRATSEDVHSLKRKGDFKDDGRGDTKRILLKEPGHQLLIPRESWWSKERSKERPPILSDDGESLPYFIVFNLFERLIGGCFFI
jgi:hypothetical protein